MCIRVNPKPEIGMCLCESSHSSTFEFSLLAHILQMLLDSKINSHISSNFCPDLQDGILKALNAN